MKYAVVYSSKTGNTRLLAEEIRKVLPAEECLYFGEPAPEALKAEVLCVGFWTDKGDCDQAVASFLSSVTDQKVFLFGTAGFGGAPAYFENILHRVSGHLPACAQLAGSFMCQGKMPMSVRARYEKMLESPEHVPNVSAMIENFDRALSHPDAEDLAALQAAVRSAV